MAMQEATIFALASAPGRAGVAVVRLSGPEAGAALLTLAPALDGTLPPARVATRVFLYESESIDVADTGPIDDGLALWFPGPRSFTGEDVVELHVHGGHAVLESILASLGRLDGLRPAEPGEFSRRAFENGKMDLTQAEAVADLVDAETAAQRRQALAQMGGALAWLYDGWRERLVASLAFAETAIDFAEEDIPDDLARRSIAEVRTVADAVRGHLADGGVGERIRDGFRIALTGAPNVGKSSLMNALAKRDVAIVSDIAGTTRDVIEVPMDLGGYAAVLIDTAGIRDSADVIEREGVRRALAQAEMADLRVHLVEAGAASADDVSRETENEILLVANKTDLATGAVPAGALPLSLKTGDGLSALIGAMTAHIRRLAETRSAAAAPLTRARHRRALEDCLAGLDRALAGFDGGADAEMVAEDLRAAAQALGRITGRVDVEELLDRIFRDFCIGK